MGKSFDDNYTKILDTKITDWGLDKIYEIEENITSLDKTEVEIIDYLKDIRCSMPIGLALRRYICTKFGVETDNGFVVDLENGNVFQLKDFRKDDYDLQKDDINDFIEIFRIINSKYNVDKQTNELSLDFAKAEIRRLFRSTTYCQRSKMFLLSFALHMNADETEKFLTDVLAEQTYNYRDPDEIIAYYCQSNNSVNSYVDYLRMKDKFAEAVKLSNPEDETEKENYTYYAQSKFEKEINTEEELIAFLVDNIPNFKGYSQTAYNEFMILFNKALEKSKIQTLSNDEYLLGNESTTKQKREEQQERINKAIELKSTTNTEQLAKAMLQFIPRATSKRIKNGKVIISNDFINIKNGKAGQQSKKPQTTTLPKEITMNMLVSDRLDDLISEKKPVTRKDLVFLKFYIFSLDIAEQEEYKQCDYIDFIDECNDMLLRCGMSKLYPANRFENLILLSLLSSNPFEMFENIMEYSFINEPECE